jgi:multiple sugar transport system substrate-binding protein
MVALTAAVAMIAPMAACTSGSSQDGKVAISFYSYFKKTQIGAVVEGFQKENPDITVDVQYGQDPQQYVQTLQTRLAGGTPPTVFNITMDNRTDVMGSNAALDLTGGDFLEGIDESNFSLFQQDGKTYGMPISAWIGAMFYNKDLLKKAGYDEFPKNWDEFIEMGEKINDSGSTAFLEDFNTQVAGSFVGLLASKYAQDGNAGQDDGIWSGDSTFTKEWTPVFEAWQKAANAGVIPSKSVGVSADQVKQEFITGSLAVMRSGPWDLEDLKGSGIDFGVAAFPAMEKGGEQWLNGGPDQGFAIAAKAKKPQQEAAKKFLSYLNSEDGLKAFTSAAGTMSLSDKYDAEPPAELKDVVDQYFTKNKFYWVNWAKSPTVMSTEDIAVQQQLVQGKISPEEAAKALDAKWSTLE